MDVVPKRVNSPSRTTLLELEDTIDRYKDEAGEWRGALTVHGDTRLSHELLKVNLTIKRIFAATLLSQNVVPSFGGRIGEMES